MGVQFLMRFWRFCQANTCPQKKDQLLYVLCFIHLALLPTNTYSNLDYAMLRYRVTLAHMASTLEAEAKPSIDTSCGHRYLPLYLLMERANERQ